MFESITLGQLVADREDSRRAGPVGDEDAMIVCLPQEAEGVLGAIVGHLNQLSPWIGEDEDDDAFWGDEGWHAADHAMDYGDYDPGLVGVLEMGGGRFRDDMRVPGAPGMFCCRPDVGYDLWNGTYDREPALWGKYSFRPLYGHAGTQEFGAGSTTFESEVSRKRQKREEQAKRIATRFARKAAEYADGPVEVKENAVTIPLTLGGDSSKAYDEIAEAAKDAARREGIYWTASRVSNDTIEVRFSANPTTQIAGYDDDGLAGLAVLLGAIEGSIENGEVIPLGNGQFGIVGDDVGNIFKKIGDAFKKKGGSNEEKLKSKLEKLWAKFDKINTEYEEASGSKYTPWEAAKAAGFEVGRGGGGGGRSSGRSGGKKHPKARQMMQQMRQQQQAQQDSGPMDVGTPSSYGDPYGGRPAPQPLPYPPSNMMQGGRAGGRRQQQGGGNRYYTNGPGTPSSVMSPGPQRRYPSAPSPMQYNQPAPVFVPPTYGAYPGYGFNGHMPYAPAIMGIWEDGRDSWAEGEASSDGDRWI